MGYTPPSESFVDNGEPVGGGLGKALDAPFFNALVAGVEDADTRVTALEPAATGIYNVKSFGAAGNGSTDDYAAFRAAIDAMPNGATLWIPPVATNYRLSQTLVIDKYITVKGSYGRQQGSGNPNFGSVLRPTTTTAQQGMTALMQVTKANVIIEELALMGLGSANGSIGLLFSGASGLASHSSKARRVTSVGFGTGFVFGNDSDHITLEGVIASGNNDGVAFQAGNRYDYFIIDSALDGNTRASMFLPDGPGVDNVTIMRSHLGFCQYGILQLNASNGNGFATLTLIDSPIEWVSEQAIKIVSGGNIRIQGGYWVWNNTVLSAKPAFEIDQVTVGPIWMNPRLEPNFPNSASPALLRVNNYTNFPVTVESALNGFAQTFYGGHATEHHEFELTPEGFGARGRNATDDTAGLAAAAAAAAAQKRPLVLRGIYRFTNLNLTLSDLTIVWQPGAVLRCTLDKVTNTIPIQITGSRVRLRNPVVDFATTVNVDVDAPTRPAAADAIRLGGASASNPAADIEVLGGKVIHARNSGVRVRFVKGLRIQDVTVDEVLGNGIAVESGQDVFITGCRVNRCGDDLIVAVASVPDYAADRSRNINVTGNTVSRGYANGINFTGVNGGVISGNIIELTYAPGVRVWEDSTFNLGGCRDIQIMSNVIRDAGKYFGTGQYKTTVASVPHSVYVVGAVQRVMVHPQSSATPQGQDIVVVNGGVVHNQPAIPATRTATGGALSPATAATTTATATLDRLTYTPVFVPARVTANALSARVSTAAAGAVLRLGLYDDTGAGLPKTLLVESAALDASTTGVKTATISQELAPGLYWLAAVNQVAAAGVTTLSGRTIGMPTVADPASLMNGYLQNAVSGALPATAGVNGSTTAATAMTLGI